MPMPEAAVHEYDFATPLEDNVGPARQAAVLKPVPVALREENASYGHLRRRVPASDGPHVSASLLRA